MRTFGTAISMFDYQTFGLVDMNEFKLYNKSALYVR